jgi:protein-S-isoprenylcysteine O-methyltransferase Ste14
MLGWILATAIVILRVQPGLLAERLGPRKGAKAWDVAIMSALGVAQLARYIVAGLDVRNGWTDALPLAAQLAALVLCIAGYTLVVWATASNAFFSQIVRLQSERGQDVVTGGPYHFVRHPAYAGAIVFELAAPVLLASWWAMIPSALGAVLLILRTGLEDRTLQAELTGYAEYAGRVGIVFPRCLVGPAPPTLIPPNGLSLEYHLRRRSVPTPAWRWGDQICVNR